MKPMLAGKVTDVNALRYPVLASPKLDGIRCLLIGGAAYSRNLKLIPNAFIQDRLKGLTGLDGELIVGSPKAADCFNRSTSAVMSRDGEPKFNFWVFDHWTDEDMGFAERLAYAKRAIVGKAKEVMHVAHKRIKSAEELLEYEAQMLLAGFEGVMVRDPVGPYKHGRSTEREGWLLKLKRFEDSEAEIVDYVERQHNANEQTRDELDRAKRSSHKANKVATGTLGAIKVRDIHSKVEFEIGTGFDDKLRAVIWADRIRFHGKIVKYKFQPTGVKDKPRFPVFVGFRDAIDL